MKNSINSMKNAKTTHSKGDHFEMPLSAEESFERSTQYKTHEVSHLINIEENSMNGGIDEEMGILTGGSNDAGLNVDWVDGVFGSLSTLLIEKINPKNNKNIDNRYKHTLVSTVVGNKAKLIFTVKEKNTCNLCSFK
jgi:hypothetical protein